MILLDTHIWVWWVNDPNKLNPATLHYLDELPPTSIFISNISCWEIAKLVEKGRIELSEPLPVWFDLAIDRAGITVIDIDRSIIMDACSLPGAFHNDPADQLITATARVKSIPLLTADHKILSYQYVDLYKG